MCVYEGGWSRESLKDKQKLVGLRSQGSRRLVRDGCGLCVCVFLHYRSCGGGVI